MSFADISIKRDRSPLNSIDRGDDNIRDRGDRDRSRRGDRPSRFGPRSSSPNSGGRAGAAERRIFVSNVAYEYRWQELKDLFRTEVGEVSFVELFTDEHNKPRGCGIVEFESVDSVKKAVDKMHRFDLNGRKLVVKEDYDTVRDKYGRPKNGGGGGGGSPGMGGGRGDLRDLVRMRDEPRGQWDNSNNSSMQAQLNNSLGQANSGGGGNNANVWGNTYGLSPQFLEGLWINGPLVTRVFVANLDYKVDQKKLKEVFKMAGRVVNAELHIDREGKSRGFGVVEYDHPVEAVQAISMFHNQMLFERKLTVRMDRVDNKPEGPVKLPEGLRSIGMGLGTNGTPLKDVARNLPSLSQGMGGGLVGSAPNGAANLTAANLSALSNVVNTSNLAGLGNSGGLPVGLGGLGNSLMGNLGGGNDLASLGANLGANLGNSAGAFGNSSLAANFGMSGGMGNLGNAAGLGVGNSFGSGGNAFLGGSGPFSSGNSATTLGGGNFGNVGGRDFESLSAALSGGGGYSTGSGDRDFRTRAQTTAFSNNPVRGMGGALQQSNTGNTSNGSRTSDTIIVKNLPMTTTWQTLRDKFRDVGDVKYAEMRTKDVALIRFTNELDAERAVHMMDRKRFDGREIDVSLFY